MDNKDYEKYLRNVIFKDNLEECDRLEILHHLKNELLEMRDSIERTPYVIEFSGTPRTGKTTIINNLNEFFSKGNFKVKVIEEFTTSERYKKEIKPIFKDMSKRDINFEIPKYVLEDLNEAIEEKPDIILADRSLFDRLVWIDRLYITGRLSDEDYRLYRSTYSPLIKDNINTIITTYVDALTAIRRDYRANLSLEQRRFLNEDNVQEFNESLIRMYNYMKRIGANISMFDTCELSQRDTSIQTAEYILNDMRKEYIKRLSKTK